MKETKQEKKETKILFQRLSVKDEGMVKGGGEVPITQDCSKPYPSMICPS